MGSKVLFDVHAGAYWNQRTNKERKGFPQVYFSGNNVDACEYEELLAEMKRQASNKKFAHQGKTSIMGKVKGGIAAAVAKLSIDEGESAALAIQTTDTFIKKVAYEFEIGGKKAKIAGIAKGAGMIHPNMATMLTYITTDAAVAPDLLKRLVKAVADKSFNMVVVDGDTSTNDSMIVLANGLAENEIVFSEEHPDYETLYKALLQTAQDLAKMIAHGTLNE